VRISAAEMRGRNWTNEYKANERQESYESKHWIRESIDKTNWAKTVKIRQQQVQAQMRESADRKKLDKLQNLCKSISSSLHFSFFLYWH
jgi:hypothetical protein